MKNILKAILSFVFRSLIYRYQVLLAKVERIELVINKLSLQDDIVEIQGAKFWVPNAPRDYVQNIILSQLNFYEIGILKKIDDCINQDSVIIDIGSNIGNHAVYWGRITNVKRIYCFEPIKTTFGILTKNIEINNIRDKTILYNCGLSDTNTTGSVLAYSAGNIGATQIRKSDDGDLQMRKLDEMVEIMNEQKVDFVKIDVEGSEKLVLQGAENFFKKFRPVVFIESREGIDKLGFVRSFLGGLNYKEHICFDFENFLFMPSEKI